MLYNIILCHIILYYIILYYAMLYYTILCSGLLYCYIILYYTTLSYLILYIHIDLHIDGQVVTQGACRRAQAWHSSAAFQRGSGAHGTPQRASGLRV